jgi:flagellar biosynthesis protein FliR
MAVLLLIDLTLGLLNQVHSRMQLITLSFTLKLLAATGVIALMLPIAPKVFEVMAEHGAETIVGLLNR